MRKMPTIFKRDFSNYRNAVVINEINPEAQWVFDGEGIATRKYDGTCCLVDNHTCTLFARYDAKHGKQPPSDFVPAQESPDPITGHWPGWVPCTRDNPRFRYHWDAFDSYDTNLPDGTYELCGPKVNGNPEDTLIHVLIPHPRAERYPDCPRDYAGLKEWLQNKDIEGIVWHHPDGRMAKIKKSDFGMTRLGSIYRKN